MKFVGETCSAHALFFGFILCATIMSTYVIVKVEK